MFDGFAFASLQTEQFFCKAVIRPFGIAVFLADKGRKACAVDFRGFRFYIHQYIIAAFNGAVHILSGGIHLAQFFESRINIFLFGSLPFVRQADGMIIAEINFRGERHAEGEFGRREAVDGFERACRAGIHIRFFEDVGIFRINEQVHGLLGDGRSPNVRTTISYGALPGRKPGTLLREEIFVAARRL